MAEITSILKPIAAPELTTPEYGQAVNTQFMNIKDNFEKLANRDFVKGESGQNLELIKIPIGIPNPDDNVLIINIEDIKSAIKTLFGLAPGDDRLKSVGNHDWDEGLKGGKFVHAYRIMDGEVYKYAFSEPIIFRDMRWVEIDDNNINDYAGIIDTSCVIYIDTDDSPYEFENIKFKAVASAPSLYYEDGDFKWRINGEKSGILARGPEGSHGTPGKTYILKAHRNDNNTGECIVTHIYQYNTAESTNADWISIEDIQDEDNKPVVGQSSIVVLDNGDIDGRHPGGYNYFYLSTIRSYKDSADEKINYAVTCVDDVNGIPIAFDDIIFNILLGGISEDADKSAMAGLFLPISSPAEDSTIRGSRAWVNSLSRHTIESSAESTDGYRNKLTIEPVKGDSSEDAFEITNAAININYPRVSFANPNNSEGVKFSHGIDTLATGGNSHAEGANTTATGINSHAEGIKTGTSTGANGSHAEGYDTATGGEGSHAEGMGTVAIGDYSHAEGIDTHTQQDGSHAEGFTTWATGMYSHAEGAGESTATGVGAHAEGSGAHAIGDYSHAEGAGMDDPTETYVTAAGVGSHAEGIGTESYKYVYDGTGHAILADGVGSHAEGENTHAGGRASHAEGFNSEALGDYSHVSGMGTRDHGVDDTEVFMWIDTEGGPGSDELHRYIKGCGYIELGGLINSGQLTNPTNGYYIAKVSFFGDGSSQWERLCGLEDDIYISKSDIDNLAEDDSYEFSLWHNAHPGIEPIDLVEFVKVTFVPDMYDNVNYIQRIQEVSIYGPEIQEVYDDERPIKLPHKFINDCASIIGKFNKPSADTIFEVGCGWVDDSGFSIRENAVSINNSGETTVRDLNSTNVSINDSLSVGNTINAEKLIIGDIEATNTQSRNTITDRETVQDELQIGDHIVLCNDSSYNALRKYMPSTPATWRSLTGDLWIPGSSVSSIQTHKCTGETSYREAKYATIIAMHQLTSDEVHSPNKLRINTGTLYGETGIDGYGIYGYYNGSNARYVDTYTNHSIFIQRCPRASSYLNEGHSSWSVTDTGLKKYSFGNEGGTGYLVDKFNAYVTSKMTYTGDWETIAQLDFTPNSRMWYSRGYSRFISSRFIGSTHREIDTTGWSEGDYIRVIYAGCLICKSHDGSGTPVDGFQIFGVGPFSTSNEISSGFYYDSGVYITADNSKKQLLKSVMNNPYNRYANYLSQDDGDIKTLICQDGLVIAKSQTHYMRILADTTTGPSGGNGALTIYFTDGVNPSKAKTISELLS